jgi:hypothetical protein
MDLIEMAFNGATADKVKCVYCERKKPIEDFAHSNGYHGTCKACKNSIESERDWDYACSLLEERRKFYAE